MNRKITQEKGITLIALVITIIIMLILAAVTINIVINGGLIGYAGNAREAQEVAQAEEKLAIEKSARYMETLTQGAWEDNGDGTYTRGTGEDVITVAIGDTINYNSLAVSDNIKPALTYSVSSNKTGFYALIFDEELGDYVYNEETGEPEREENTIQTFNLPEADANGTDGLTWKVIGIENGYIQIAPIEGQKLQTIGLDGKEGVQNGVEILNNISELYGYGEGAVGARSIKVEDINNLVKSKVANFNPTSDTPEYGTKLKYRKVANTNPQEGDLRENRIEYYDETEKEWKDTGDWNLENFEYYKNGNWGELTVGGAPVELEYTWYRYTLYNGIAEDGIIYNQTTDFKNLVTAGASSRIPIVCLLATPITCCNTSGYAGFSLSFTVADEYSGNLGYENDGVTTCYCEDGAVRPVVSLRSDIQLSKVDGVWEIQ